jgi:hypothetical protein
MLNRFPNPLLKACERILIERIGLGHWSRHS